MSPATALSRPETLIDPRPLVLVGTESDLTAAVLTAALRADGYDVVVVSTTRGIVDRVNAMWSADGGSCPELIILQFTRPAWANLAMLEYVRKVDWAMPVVLVGTPKDEGEQREEARRLGATFVFECSFEVEDLRTAVVNSVPNGLTR